MIVLQPLNGFVFALDGVLMGASDTGFLARAMLASVMVAAAVVAAADVRLGTPRGVNWGLGTLMLARACGSTGAILEWTVGPH